MYVKNREREKELPTVPSVQTNSGAKKHTTHLSLLSSVFTNCATTVILRYIPITYVKYHAQDKTQSRKEIQEANLV